MRYLLDTGILVRLLHRSDPFHPVIIESLRRLTADRHIFATSTQNIAEFWNVCTRPAVVRGGFGLSIKQTRKRLQLLERFITVLREPASAYEKWKNMIVACNVEGKQVHDA